MSVIMGIFMGQLRLVTKSGIKGKDDAIDTMSQLTYLTPWKPSESAPITHEESDLWEEQHEAEAVSGLSSYIV